MTENTTASGAADLHAMLRSAANNIAYAMDNLAGMTLAELPQGMLDSTGAAESGLLAERTIREVMGLLAASAPVAPTQPDWRELCRRLYVELFHCDKQMTCSLNEDGEPIWRTGTEVRDVLSDAKAALEANTITREAAPVAPAPQPPAGLLSVGVRVKVLPNVTRYNQKPWVGKVGTIHALCGQHDWDVCFAGKPGYWDSFMRFDPSELEVCQDAEVAAAPKAAPAPAAEDAERWREFQKGKPLVVKMAKSTVIYGPNHEREFPDALNKAVDHARAQAAQPEGGAES